MIPPYSHPATLIINPHQPTSTSSSYASTSPAAPRLYIMHNKLNDLNMLCK
jgi:hypothetical protein